MQVTRFKGILSYSAFARRPWTRRFRTSATSQDIYKSADLKTFTEITQLKDRLVLVDFYADWCGPCRQLSPVLEKFGSDPNFKSGANNPVDVIKVDIDSDDGALLAQQYKVSAVPTVFAMKNGETVDQFRGAIPESAVREFIERL